MNTRSPSQLGPLRRQKRPRNCPYDYLEREMEELEAEGIKLEVRRLYEGKAPEQPITTNNDEVCDKDSEIARELRKLFHRHNITREARNDIISVLRTHGHPNLPCGKRIMKMTGKAAELITDVKGGRLFYRGIAKGLLNVVTEIYLKERDTILLDFSWDGLAPYKSSKTHVWPLLGRLARTKTEVGSSPFLVAVFCGEEKPDPHEFMSDFVREMKKLETEGLFIGSKHYHVKISKLIADQPARARIHCHRGEGPRAFVQCERCEVVGKSRPPGQHGTTTFNSSLCRGVALRTDKSFREQRQPEYHMGDSPLLPLNIDMVYGLVLDPMHVLWQGIVGRFWDYLTDSNFVSKYKIKKSGVEELSKYMVKKYKDCFPDSFARRVRGLTERASWKATEWRRFLLYEGLLIIKKFLSKDRPYRSFLMLFCAVRILSSEELISNKKLFHDAGVLLKLFVEDLDKTFDKKFVCMKPHNLTHIIDDCERHGVLENFSAFPFESYLHKINCSMNAHGMCLEQIIRRLKEEEFIDKETVPSPCDGSRSDEPQLFHEHESGPVAGLNGRQFSTAVVGQLRIRLTNGDSTFRTRSGDIICVLNIVATECNEVFVVGKKIPFKTDFFHWPMKSSLLGVVQVWGLEDDLRSWNVSDLKDKCVLLPLDDERRSRLCLPLVHDERREFASNSEETQ